MRHLLIVAAAATACAGDEVITTFGNDWALTSGWDSVGQTFVVPDSNRMMSLAFVGMTTDEATPGYTAYLFRWDEQEHHVLGAPVWFESGTLPLGEAGLRTHQIDALLPRGDTYLIGIFTTPGPGEVTRIAHVDDAYDEGELVATNFDFWHTKWQLLNGLHDMYLSMAFKSCPADFNGDASIDVLDFVWFQGAFTAGKAKADCNADGTLNVLDFVCFQAKFQAGCGNPWSSVGRDKARPAPGAARRIVHGA